MKRFGKDSMKGQISLLDPIFIDHFAGGGGASTGFELATGRPMTIAINHDPDAIAMHSKNHPFTEHYQESVWEVNPEEACKGRRVALMWLSPDCKHFSRAKGGKPVDKNIRGLAWIAVKWARRVHPDVIILENVPEFITWGKLLPSGKPDPKHKGAEFNKFVRHLQREGYQVKWTKMRACDYGAPTIRERFFLIARCDGKPIVFPEPTHGKGKLPYRTAAECIDWSIPCKSIFNRKKPLAVNTMRRIARGLDKFVIKSDKPFIISADKDKSAPSLIQYHSETAKHEIRGQKLEKPFMTLDTSNRYGLQIPFLSKFYGGITGVPITEPMPTVTAVDHNALTAAHIVKYYQGEEHGASTNDPMHTITTKDRMGLVESHLCVLRKNTDCKSLLEPIPTLTASPGHMAQIKTYLVRADDCKDLGNWNEIRQLLNEYCGYNIAADEILLFEINNALYYIHDIGMRMLEPRELYKAQGFPDDYIIDFIQPNGKPYPKSAQVARCGNAVVPQCAEALIRANLPEYCDKRFTSMADIIDNMAV